MTRTAAPPAHGRSGRVGDAVRTFLRGLGQTLITLGVVVLLFAFYEVYVTNLYTDREQARLGDRIQQTWALPEPSPAKVAVAPMPGNAFAVLRMPRIEKTNDIGPGGAQVVVEGVSVEDLKKGPGHYPGTALPGAVGNFVVSGHRTTYGAPFNRVDELRVGDPIVVETRDTWFTYRVTGLQVVAPSAIEVTWPVPGKRGATPTEQGADADDLQPQVLRAAAAHRVGAAGDVVTQVGRHAGCVGGLRCTAGCGGSSRAASSASCCARWCCSRAWWRCCSSWCSRRSRRCCPTRT